MELKFRQLRADEIDCRVAQIKQNGLSLLLYKDARCDMNILDETVGCLNWQRHHSRDNANCIVSIWDDEKKQWIEKEDTGTESNTEAAKGICSDSFKRSCFNFGIGRELYTAPFIWVGSDKCEIKQGNNGKAACYDKFAVRDIGYTDGKISQLTIWNTTKNCVAYEMGKRSSQPKQKTQEQSEDEIIRAFIQHAGENEYAVCSKCGKAFYAFSKKDGSVMSVHDMLALGIRDLGKPVCKDCYKEALRESKGR